MSEQWQIALISNAIVLFVGFIALWGWSLKITWGFADAREEIKQLLEAHAEEDRHQFQAVRDEIDSTARSFGETVQAVRQKIADVELRSAETYVRRDGFYKSIEALTSSIIALRREIKDDLQRMEAKLDLQDLICTAQFTWFHRPAIVAGLIICAWGGARQLPIKSDKPENTNVSQDLGGFFLCRLLLRSRSSCSSRYNLRPARLQTLTIGP